MYETADFIQILGLFLLFLDCIVKVVQSDLNQIIDISEIDNKKTPVPSTQNKTALPT